MDDEDEANHATSQPFLSFDPNYADSITLKAVGVKKLQQEHDKYRESKGGI